MYTTILFDLDGTLTDASVGIGNSIQYALEKQKLPAISTKALKAFIGPPLAESFRSVCMLNEGAVKQAIEDYRTYYKRVGFSGNHIYPGITNLLSGLKRENKQVLVATSKPEIYAKKILNYLDLSRYFDGIYGASLDGTVAAKEEVIKYALTSQGFVDLKKCVMVGDRKYDSVGAKKNGIASIGVLYGFGTKEELVEAGSDYIVATPVEISSIIN